MLYQVEEIDDIDDDPSDPFVADAIANEKELDLSEEQRKKYKKVGSTFHTVVCCNRFSFLFAI